MARCAALPERRVHCGQHPASLADLFRTNQSSPVLSDTNAGAVPASSQSRGPLVHPNCHSPPIIRSEPFPGTVHLSPALPLTASKSLATESTNTALAGSSSADESDQSAVTRLSKSLVEDSLFRNPHTLPPPKKSKRKPAPIFIPPQTGANLSRLRSPRVWGSDGSALSTSPLPYTPPPMLSPNRRGSGLFSSLTRWPSTASPVVATRRYSSYYPYLSSTCAQSATDVVKRKSSHTPVLSFGPGETDGAQLLLKRSYTGRLLDSGSSNEMGSMSGSGLTTTTTSAMCTAGICLQSRGPSHDTTPRQFALPRRRCQLTPKSAPVLLQEASAYMFQTCNRVSVYFVFNVSQGLFRF
ncbi:unnamed protein product [Echinostoma caproni]|uniref:Uncharacterized protein n=1 Tax=Echinostoma caproni TaxID=27848 RepID=A0A3P8LAW3_9TREM|nr:unnamed protein product [Echinostoma caproni]